MYFSYFGSSCKSQDRLGSLVQEVHHEGGVEMRAGANVHVSRPSAQSWNQGWTPGIWLFRKVWSPRGGSTCLAVKVQSKETSILSHWALEGRVLEWDTARDPCVLVQLQSQYAQAASALKGVHNPFPSDEMICLLRHLQVVSSVFLTQNCKYKNLDLNIWWNIFGPDRKDRVFMAWVLWPMLDYSVWKQPASCEHNFV